MGGNWQFVRACAARARVFSAEFLGNARKRASYSPAQRASLKKESRTLRPGFVGNRLLLRELVEEPDQLLAAARLLQLAHSLGLDLANSLAGHFENVTDFLER